MLKKQVLQKNVCFAIIGTLKIFILVLMKCGKKAYGKNLISGKILIRSIIFHIIMMSKSINMVVSTEQRQDFEKIRVELMK